MLIERIGEPAALELLAEECTELAHAALKLARAERGENPTPMKPEECCAAVIEEWADVIITAGELESLSWWSGRKVALVCSEKYSRMVCRLQGVERKSGFSVGWFKCDIKPENGQHVLVSLYDRHWTIWLTGTAVWFDDEGWIVDFNDEGDYVVVAWQPMPRPSTARCEESNK